MQLSKSSIDFRAEDVDLQNIAWAAIYFSRVGWRFVLGATAVYVNPDLMLSASSPVGIGVPVD